MKKILMICMAALLLFTGCGKENIQQDNGETKVQVRVGSLKGPTTLGLLFLMEESKQKTAVGDYEFTMATTADELLPMMIRGELDVALVPANVAAVLYQRMEQQVVAISINTLGVLYMVSGDGSIASIQDLIGKTIYLTGKGTTPDHVLHYLLEANGILEDQVQLEYKSEASEVAAVLATEPESVGLLPQPFVTAACAQNEALQVVLDLTAEWESVQGENGSSLVTGVTLVRKAFLEENPDAVALFIEEHGKSVESIAADVETGASYAVEAGIINAQPIAQKAIPNCNIVCIVGEDMKQALSGYIQVLYDQNPESVGGALPGEDFYGMVTEE